MKNKRIFETGIKAAAILVLLLITLKCTAQTLRISTDPGLILFTESGNPDEICVSFGVLSGAIIAEHLRESDLTRKVSVAVDMANDAADIFPVFLKKNNLKSNIFTRQYFARCEALRRQFLSVMPERALLELRTLTAYF
jgi:hypothetical protein